jgi:hypothetical protein
VDDRVRYADIRPYVVPDLLAELAGPTEGVVELPRHLDWSEQHQYHMDKTADVGLMYERVIRESLNQDDLARFLNRTILVRMWTRLYLPMQVRRLWEDRFRELARVA